MKVPSPEIRDRSVQLDQIGLMRFSRYAIPAARPSFVGKATPLSPFPLSPLCHVFAKTLSQWGDFYVLVYEY